MATLKKKLKNNQLTIGSWITLPDPAIAEIMANAGFDWLTVDMEHSAITLPEAQNLIRIIKLAGSAPLVRVGKNDPSLIKRVMDAGADGVIVPMVNSEADAIKAVNAVKYPPLGTRGVGLARAQGYGLEFEKYKQWLARESVVIVQIEHIEAIGNLEEILSVKGVDGSLIGPYDLSASLGYPGEFYKRKVKNAVKKYTEVCRKLRKPAGIHAIPPYAEKLNAEIKKRFKFVAFSLDTLFLGKKVNDELARIKR